MGIFGEYPLTQIQTYLLIICLTIHWLYLFWLKNMTCSNQRCHAYMVKFPLKDYKGVIEIVVCPI